MLKTKLDSLKKENGELHEKNKEIDDLKTENIKLQKQLEANSTDSNKRLESLEREVEAMTIIRKDLNEKVDSLHLVLTNNKKDIDFYKKEIEELKNTIEEKDSENQYIKEKIRFLENDKSDLKRELDEKTEQDKQKEQELKDKIIEMDKELSEKDDVITSLNEKNGEYLELETEMKNLKEQLKDKYEEVMNLKSENIKISQHLQNSLQLVKKATSTEQIDKELISNLFATFVTIPRGESRKYEVLELISSFLDWDDMRKKEVGLLYDENNLKNKNSKKEKGINENSIVGRWTEFLEKESEK